VAGSCAGGNEQSSLLTDDLLAYREELRSMKLVTYLIGWLVGWLVLVN